MENQEVVTMISVSEIRAFPKHPFHIVEDESMKQLQKSIQEVGVMTPVLVRELEMGKYELISGHRRVQACKNLGIKKVPAIIRDVDSLEATIMMVDSNLNREKILHSEKAFAYKMKLDAIRCQGARFDLTSVQRGQKSGQTSREFISENSPDGCTQIQRYIRLTELIPEMLQKVDEGKLSFTAGVEASYLFKTEQRLLLNCMESEQSAPSLSQVQRMRRLSRARLLTEESMLKIMTEKKKPEAWKLALSVDKISKYFPVSYTPRKMEKVIFELLKEWKQSQEHQKVEGEHHV